MFLLSHDKFEGLKSDHTHGSLTKKTKSGMRETRKGERDHKE